MKVIIEFNLPEDQEEFIITSDAYKYRNTVLSTLELIRSKLKHDDELNDKQADILEYIREHILDEMNDPIV